MQEYDTVPVGLWDPWCPTCNSPPASVCTSKYSGPPDCAEKNNYSWTPLCWTRLSQTPCYLELFLATLSPNQPWLSQTLLQLKKLWSKSVRKCSQGTLWQDVMKAEKCIDMFTVTNAKSNIWKLPENMSSPSYRCLNRHTVSLFLPK